MKFKYLNRWVEEFNPLKEIIEQKDKLIFQEIQKFEDQYRIVFRRTKFSLNINFSSNDSFVFLSKMDLLPFKLAGNLTAINGKLINSRLISIKIVNEDRILSMQFRKINIYNQLESFNLICELIPHYQNLILSSEISKKNTIIDSLRRISFAENTQRQILPSLEYCPPQTDFKNIADEIVYPIKISKNLKLEENIVSEKGSSFTSMNSLFEALFEEILLNKTEQIKKQKILQIEKIIKRKKKKLSKLDADFSIAEEMQKWKEWAELLKANFNSIKKGQTKISLTNYYSDEFPIIEIPIFADKNSKQNIEYYFKKYRKARDGKIKIAEQIEITNKEIDHFEKEIFDIEEIDSYIEIKEINKKNPQNLKTKKKASKGFKKIVINDSWEIYIGRTSTENDQLTTRFSKPNDWWFHTRIFRGTHLILRNLERKELPDDLKFICCRIAAYYSKAKKSSNVPVDYTQIRYVRKPKGSPVGYVIYKNQKTLYVDPLSMRDAIKQLGTNK